VLKMSPWARGIEGEKMTSLTAKVAVGVGLVVIPVTLYSVWAKLHNDRMGFPKPPYRSISPVTKVTAAAVSMLFLIPLWLDGVGWLGMTLYAIACIAALPLVRRFALWASN
jgi:hypothetical protein